MENRVPLPTDNIFKFYALFGLLLVVFGAGAVIYVTNSTNDLVFEIAVEYEVLRADPERTMSQEARFQVLEKKLEIAEINKVFYIYALGVLVALGVFMMFYGFRKWHVEVQPVQDKCRVCILKSFGERWVRMMGIEYALVSFVKKFFSLLLVALSDLEKMWNLKNLID